MAVTEKERSQINKHYTDIKFPNALGGLYRFYKTYKQTVNPKIKFKDIKLAVESLPIYQLHVQRKTRFPKRRIKKPPGSQSK